MIRSSARRRAAGNPMVVAVIALLIALVGLGIALFRDPMKPGFAFGNSFGDGLGGYDFDSPSAAAKSEMLIRQNMDLRAMMALERKFKDKEAQEHLDTLKIDKEVDFKLKKKDSTADYKVLFTSFKRKGDDQKQVVTMEKHESGLWHRKYLSSTDVEKDNKDLAKEMREWERSGDFNPPMFRD